jgi:hypothetical protein
MIQSVIFDKHKWTSKRAIDWLLKHNYQPIKVVHETKNFYRFRLRPPRKNAQYFTKNLGNGIELVISY